MAAQTPAQEEFAALVAKQSAMRISAHPEDSRHTCDEDSEEDEESAYQRKRVETEMSYTSGGSSKLILPPSDFDSGARTGVRGVIADARSFEAAKHERSKSSQGGNIGNRINRTETEKRELIDGGADEDVDSEDDEFLEKWREERRLDMERAAREGNDIRNRRTSPSVRRYGRFDEVDALGYLDAVEKVGMETVVVVFVYDIECPVSEVIEVALTPLVAVNPHIHFVKVHYDEVDFDNAGVPAILAYKNQGDLFANLTYVIDQIPEDVLFDTKALKDVLVKHRVL